jgi:hypothetical protein
MIESKCTRQTANEANFIPLAASTSTNTVLTLVEPLDQWLLAYNGLVFWFADRRGDCRPGCKPIERNSSEKSSNVSTFGSTFVTECAAVHEQSSPACEKAEQTVGLILLRRPTAALRKSAFTIVDVPEPSCRV